MNKQEIYNYLEELNIWHEIAEHKAVFNMAELSEIDIPYPESDAKNLFLHDDKKRNYYLITVKRDKRVDLKSFREQSGTRSLCFASEKDLTEILGLAPGSVTPLGILNDKSKKIHVYVDSDLTKPPYIISVHPNENTATVWLKTNDLIEIMKKHGNPASIVQI